MTTTYPTDASLVRVLSIGSEQARCDACAQLMVRIQQTQLTPSRLLQLDSIPPLLLGIQTQSTGSIASPFVTSATRLLHQMLTETRLRVFESGWSFTVDKESGRVTYRETNTGRTQNMPPQIGTVQNGAESGSETEAEWVSCLLAELPLLCAPRMVDGTPRWLAHVRFHRPASENGVEGAVTVIDVAPEIESAVTVTTTKAAPTPTDSIHPPAEGTSRQLVLGTWQGVACAFRETEADLSYAPGEHLETWYTVTLTAVALVATSLPAAGTSTTTAATTPSTASSSVSFSPSRPPRVVVIGLGGGALVSFLSRYVPALALECVELNKTVVEVAERWFGVNVKRDGEDDASASLAATAVVDPALRAGFASPSSGNPVLVHTIDAAAFLSHQPDSSIDLILLDVYTSGQFPPSLLIREFFGQMRRCLGQTGLVAINAGIGDDRAAVVKLTQEAFGKHCTQLLLDRKEVSRTLEGATDAAENGVVVGGGLAASSTSVGFDAPIKPPTLRILSEAQIRELHRTGRTIVDGVEISWKTEENPWSSEDASHLRHRVSALDADPSCAPFLVHALLDGSSILAHIGAHSGPTTDGTVEVGFIVSEKQRGKGVGTKIVREFLCWLHGAGVRRVIATVLPSNASSISILTRMGFESNGEVVDEEDGERMLAFQLSLRGRSLLRERMSVVQWRKSIVETRSSDLPPLPFELASARNDDDADPPSMQLTWRGVELEKYEARAEKLKQRVTKAKAKPQKIASKEDAAWALFD